jgi:hypothetical protein
MIMGRILLVREAACKAAGAEFDPPASLCSGLFQARVTPLGPNERKG